MSWDDTKSSGDLIASADYNLGVTDQKTRGIPKSENKLGSNCSGSDSESNRVLTLTESTIKLSGIIVIKNGTALHEGAGKDYTIATNKITFLGLVWDADNIRIVYFT